MSPFELTINRYIAKSTANTAITTLSALYSNNNYLPLNMYSGGKDSSCSTSVSMVAWAKAIKNNPALQKVPFIIITNNTRNEQPVKQNYIETQFELFRAFAKQYNINLVITETEPQIASSWQCKVIGGVVDNYHCERTRGHPCAINWKIEPTKRELRKWSKLAGTINFEVLRVLGSRLSESTTRAINMKKLGANANTPVTVDGYSSIYPLTDWSLDDVGNYLTYSDKGLSGEFPAITSGFFDTVRLYNDMNGGECSWDTPDKSSCGSRDGCWNCFASSKPDLDSTLVDYHPHVKPLSDFRNFMILHDADYNNRNWIQSLSKNGFVNLKPGAFCGRYLETLLGIGLTIQIREVERANRVKREVESGTYIPITRKKALTTPQFTLFKPSDILFINLSWMTRGLASEPHKALKIYRDVMFRGVRYEMSDYKPSKEPLYNQHNLKNGRVYLGDMSLENPLTLEDTENLLTGWEVDELTCEAILEESTLDTWIGVGATSFDKAINMVIRSGAVRPPKGQVRAFNDRVDTASKLYASGLAGYCYAGGTVT